MQIILSALGPSIAEQLAKMGLEQIGKPVEMLDRFNQAITLLHIHGCLTDCECQKARKRLMKMVKIQKIVSTHDCSTKEPL